MLVRMLGCLGCRRFLHEDAAVCPFCGTARASGPAPSVLAVALGVMLAACGPSAGDDDGAGDDTSTGSTTQSTTATTTASTTASTTVGTSVGTTMSDESTTTLDTGSTADTQDVTDDEGAAFYGGPRPDGGGGPLECNSWAQDCPEGEKCMPWANDGGNSWNALKCTPLAEDPGAPGDPCTVEGSGVSGIDDCELGAMCWAVDPDTNIGHCVAMCTGSPDAPICEDPATACAIANDGVLHLCLPTCDPLAPMCPEGESCFPVGDEYVCSPG